jgi:hypothetical protein
VTDMRSPAGWYPLVRAMQRQLVAHLGPTNSECVVTLCPPSACIVVYVMCSTWAPPTVSAFE